MGASKILTAAAAGGAVVAAGLTLAGCGGTATVSGPDPIARAADVTAGVPGYRVAGAMSISLGAAGSSEATLTGIVDRRPRAGSLTVRESVAGRDVTATEKFAGTTLYMNAAQLAGPHGSLPGGKPWIKYDASRAAGAMQLSSLDPGGSDPSQFVDYLRAAGGSTTRVGTQTLRGVPTTHYHSLIDLDRYPASLPAARRAAAKHGISRLEAALGSHQLPVDVWIDAAKRVRRMSFEFGECVQNHRLHAHMSLDLFDYGTQPRPTLPPASQTYDATALVARTMRTIKPGCPSA